MRGKRLKNDKMKVLAVIPARAGSKGIPNKNVRIIGGHPMIYYAIKNAVESKYITDIVVSTDSQIVRLIAEQMGVVVKWRDESLCRDDVTLDAVIYDAIPKDIQWDYIVTMQPTSPTLQVTTLDAAMEYAIEKNTDTLISAINAPHLSWRDEEGRKLPNYEKRLNRQYLPANYLETGAFVISRAEVVRENTRIGKKVDVYEISDTEAVDVDNFNDLVCVSNILSQPRVAIYVNGNRQRGMGHIYRALEVADEFNVKPDIYYDQNQTECGMFGTTTHQLIPVNGIMDLFQRCKEKQYTIFINDILSTSIDYMIGLRSVLPKCKIVNFEDCGEGAHAADLVFNALLNEEPSSRFHAGEKYYISGKTFLIYEPIRINERVRNILITFGGADPKNYTDRLLQMIAKDSYANFHFTVVLGRVKDNAIKLMEYNQYSHIDVIQDVQNMPELMSHCDIAITSRGRTCYELAMLGVPTITMAQNEREEQHGFASSENGFTYIGVDPLDEIIQANLDMYLHLSKESRSRYQEQMLSHDLRGGRRRVMDLILGV